MGIETVVIEIKGIEMLKLCRMVCLLLLTTLYPDPAFSIKDSDFNCPWTDDACKSRGNLWMKLEGLYDIRLGSWRGEERLEGNTETSGAGNSFCITSFKEVDYDKFAIRDYQISILGSLDRSGNHALRSGRGRLPLTFSLKGKGRAVRGVEKTFKSNDSVYIRGSNTGHETCLDYSFILSAQLLRSDIQQRGREGSYWGDFTVRATDVISGLTLNKKFDVSVYLEKTFKISGLNDVYLNVQDVKQGWLHQDMDFCVHVLGGEHYRLQIHGQNHRDGTLALRHSTNHEIPYRMSFQASNLGREFTIYRSGYVGWFFRGSRSEDCDGGNNAVLRVEIQERDLRRVAPGSYTDVVEVTVGAH